MPPLYCFIDDARFELDNFRAHAAWAFAPAEVVCAPEFAAARAALGQRVPELFLLDLYGSDPNSPPPALPAPEELAALLGVPPDLAALYRGLGRGPEAGNLFLRRLHAEVARWQNAFSAAAGRLGQSAAFGLANLARVRAHYPKAVALAYSRKAFYADAVAFGLAGGDGVLQKPQGGDDQAIAEATRRQAPELATACRAALARKGG